MSPSFILLFPALLGLTALVFQIREKPNFALRSWITFGSGELQVHFQEEQLTQKQLRKSLFLSTESLPTGDLPHPWDEQPVFSAPALPAVYPRFVGSVSPREQFQRAGRCSTAVLGAAVRFAAPPAAREAGTAGEATEF